MKIALRRLHLQGSDLDTIRLLHPCQHRCRGLLVALTPLTWKSWQCGSKLNGSGMTPNRRLTAILALLGTPRRTSSRPHTVQPAFLLWKLCRLRLLPAVFEVDLPRLGRMSERRLTWGEVSIEELHSMRMPATSRLARGQFHRRHASLLWTTKQLAPRSIHCKAQQDMRLQQQQQQHQQMQLNRYGMLNNLCQFHSRRSTEPRINLIQWFLEELWQPRPCTYRHITSALLSSLFVPKRLRHPLSFLRTNPHRRFAIHRCLLHRVRGRHHRGNEQTELSAHLLLRKCLEAQRCRRARRQRGRNTVEQMTYRLVLQKASHVECRFFCLPGASCRVDCHWACSRI